MARTQRARAKTALAFEMTYCTPPARGFTKMPFASTTLGPNNRCRPQNFEAAAGTYRHQSRLLWTYPRLRVRKQPIPMNYVPKTGRFGASRSRPACPRCRAVQYIPAVWWIASIGRWCGWGY